MADGSYGRSPFYQTSASPADSTAKYTANVSRKKTRKWVEAKTINYDGAGWGDEDEDEDEEDDQTPEPAPPLPTGPRNLPSMVAAGATAAAPAPAGSASAIPSAAIAPIRVGSPALRARQGSLPSQQPASAPSLPSLLTQQQPQSQPSPWRQGAPAHGVGSAGGADVTTPYATRPSPQFRASSPGGGAASGASSPRSGSRPPAVAGPRPWAAEVRSQSPLGPRAQSPATSGRAHFVRPSDIYKRVGSDEASPKAGEPASDDRGKNEATQQPVAAAAVAPVAPAAPAAPVAPTSLPTQNTISSPLSSRPSLQPQHKPQDSVHSTTSSAADEAGDLRRFSTSPKLPDLARFSTFSPELLFGGSSFLSASDAPPVPSLPSSPGAASWALNPQDGARDNTEHSPSREKRLSGAAADKQHGRLNAKHQNDSISSAGESVAAARDSTVTAATATTANTMLSDDSSGRSTDVPTGTNSSHEYLSKPTSAEERLSLEIGSDKASLHEKPAALSVPVNAHVTPTAPLNPHRGSLEPLDVSAPVIAPPQLERTATLSTVTNSPQKESDILREEIIRTLSPDKSATSDTGPSEEQEQPANTTTRPEGAPGEPARQLTRESSYLQSVYDDYWTADDVTSPDHKEETTGHGRIPSVPPLSPSAATAAAAAAAAVAAGSAAAGTTAASPAATPAALAAVPEAKSLGATSSTGHKLRRRFSWEAGAEEEEEETSAPALSAPAALGVNTIDARRASATDGHSFVSAVSPMSPMSPATAAPGPGALPVATTPSPVSDGPSPTENTTQQGPVLTLSPANATAATEVRPESMTPHIQAPVRSMLDIGPEEPAEPKSVATLSAESTPSAQPTETLQSPQSPPAELARPTTAATTEAEQHRQSAQQEHNGAIYTPADGTGQFLTLRQCMAFGTHEERMVKLAETRREYANADSGLGSWLAAMTSVPEYSRAASNPLWDTPSSPPPSRPLAQHVNIPSGSQISHKGKEILTATGRAGKGLLALRKKGFHKKVTS